MERQIQTGEGSEEQAEVGGLLATWSQVLLGSELMPGGMSAPAALLKLWSVLMSLVPITTGRSEDRAAQSGLQPSLAAALGRAGPNHHWLQH